MLVIYRRLGEAAVLTAADGRTARVTLVGILHPGVAVLAFQAGDAQTQRIELDREERRELPGFGLVSNLGHSSAGARLGFAAPASVRILRAEIVHREPRAAPDDFAEGILP